MQRKINEVWSFEDKQLKTIEAELCWPYCCTCCFFMKDCKCTGILEITGDCRPRWRNDKKQVIFVQE